MSRVTVKFSGIGCLGLLRFDFGADSFDWIACGVPGLSGTAESHRESGISESGISESGIRDSLTVRLSLSNGALHVTRAIAGFAGSSEGFSVL